MKVKHKIWAGVAGGAAVAWGVRAWLRSRRRIELSGRVVIVTGGSTGLGLMVARMAAQRGASVVIAARGEENLRAAEDELRELGGEVLAVPTDVSDEGQVRTLVARTIERFGRVDILVNNAGTIQVGPAQAMNRDDFEKAMATNFWGELHAILAVLPQMRAQGGGRIANVVSVGGKVSVPHLLPYSASKFALTGLTEGLRAELARDNILVTGIYPGTIRTGGHTHAEFKGDRNAEYTWFALSDTVPGISTSAESCARELWEAVLNGDPEVVVGWNARLVVFAHHLFPGWMTEAFSLINRALPSGGENHGPSVRGEDLTGKVPETLNRLIPHGARPQQV
ncbi:SDR family NAD(P)-dependent oxidoreductase [Tundrisphaera lichenicola]|uniref:SDR family NAD(P)-dependent oxidoreductase n=1 Tax=Tundrisphaera lichenicola TaxID=2029860 RepID=UPI003EC0B835